MDLSFSTFLLLSFENLQKMAFCFFMGKGGGGGVDKCIPPSSAHLTTCIQLGH